MSSNPVLRAVGLFAILACLSALPTVARANVFNMPAGQTSVQMVTIGDPGNAPDQLSPSDNPNNLQFGAVNYVYQMDKYDVTTAQYTQFLNAVAATDTYGLYDTHMDGGLPGIGIAQDGYSGRYTYSVIGNGNVPVFDVSWGDAARFCNWLANSQPAGVEGAGTTETGAYTLNGAISNAALMAIVRNATATYVIPSEDEWYKSAYYKGGGTDSGYWSYATQSNAVPYNGFSALGTNNANYSENGGYTDWTNFLTSVGAFASSPSAYGTFDQTGDVWNWNETNISGLSRGERGGDWDSVAGLLPSSIRGDGTPISENNELGFRVALVPEPSSLTLLAVGAAAMLLWARRRRA